MQTQKYCKSCDKEILAISEENKNKVNHVLHLLLTIVTVFIPIPFPGWWAIIWVILGFISMITPTWWRCSVCGGLAQLDKDTSKAFSDFGKDLSDFGKAWSFLIDVCKSVVRDWGKGPRKWQMPRTNKGIVEEHRNDFSTNEEDGCGESNYAVIDPVTGSEIKNLTRCKYIHPNISHEEWDKIADVKDRDQW